MSGGGKSGKLIWSMSCEERKVFGKGFGLWKLDRQVLLFWSRIKGVGLNGRDFGFMRFCGLCLGVLWGGKF